MKVYIGSDHRGVNFKQKIISILDGLGVENQDVGTHSTESCDYPRIAYKVATMVAGNDGNRGVLVCMSGVGQAMAANKVSGAYAALCCNAEAAKLSREHNNANILVLGEKFVDVEELENIIQIWFNTDFEGGRHQRRIDLIKDIEQGKEI